MNEIGNQNSKLPQNYNKQGERVDIEEYKLNFMDKIVCLYLLIFLWVIIQFLLEISGKLVVVRWQFLVVYVSFDTRVM